MLIEAVSVVYTCPMFTGKKDNSVDEFWEEFEAATGEKVLAKSMGKYLSGWDEYAETLWGLTVATSGGFRFHHFPKEATFFGVARMPSIGSKPPKEKTFFIHRDAMLSVELAREKRWWKKLVASPFSLLIICYHIDGKEKKVRIEIDFNADIVADALKGLCAALPE